MTFAHFQTPGNTPSVKDLLIKPVRIGAMTSEVSFNKRALSSLPLTDRIAIFSILFHLPVLLNQFFSDPGRLNRLRKAKAHLGRDDAQSRLL